MADDIRERLKERLRQSGGELPGAEARRLTSGEIAERVEAQRARAEAQKDAPLYAFVAYDITGSMKPYIEIVRDNIQAVGKELFGEETGIHLAVWGVGDHTDGTDWLQKNTFTSGIRTLEEQIGGIRLTHGGDAPEAYECAFRELAQFASEVRAGHPKSKVATIFIADSVPHGMEGYGYWDDGCPNGVNYRVSSNTLKANTHLFYLVGCSEYGEMIELQKTLINPQNPNERYIPLGSMAKDLPALLIAAIKQVRDPVHMDAYLKTLGNGQAGRVREYLGLPPPGK